LERYKFNDQLVAWGSIGEGDPIVLIHGTPFSSQVWRKIAPLLAKDRKVFYFDLLGYGQSEMHDGQDVSLGIQNELLVRMISEWNLNEPEILCHDFGAATALRSYYKNELRYKKVTIFDAVAIAPWGSPFVQHVRKHESALSGLPSYAHDALLAAYIQGAVYSDLSQATMNIYMSPWQGDVGQAAFYRQIAQMDQLYTDEVEKLYGPMDCPVQILWGENDEWIPPSQGQKLADNLSNGEITLVPNAGHLLQEDAPEAIIAALLQH